MLCSLQFCLISIRLGIPHLIIACNVGTDDSTFLKNAKHINCKCKMINYLWFSNKSIDFRLDQLE